MLGKRSQAYSCFSWPIDEMTKLKYIMVDFMFKLECTPSKSHLFGVCSLLSFSTDDYFFEYVPLVCSVAILWAVDAIAFIQRTLNHFNTLIQWLTNDLFSLPSAIKTTGQSYVWLNYERVFLHCLYGIQTEINLKQCDQFEFLQSST